MTSCESVPSLTSDEYGTSDLALSRGPLHGEDSRIFWGSFVVPKFRFSIGQDLDKNEIYLMATSIPVLDKF